MSFGLDWTDIWDCYNQVYLFQAEGAGASRISGIELESLISNVKDLLPDLGDGFIEVLLHKCLLLQI